jgi:hypothetical protein
MKKVKTTSSAIKAASREHFKGLDLRTRINSKPKGYNRAAEKRARHTDLGE